MPCNSALNENEKGEISAYKVKGKSINLIARELLRSRIVVRNYLKGPENVPVVHQKLLMQPDVDFFKKFLKDYQAQRICKNLRI